MDGSDGAMRIERLGYTLDAGAGARARIGLLVLESDQTLEAEFAAMIGRDEIALYHARLANEVVITPQSLARMADELPVAARLLPKYLGLSAIGYGCTSAATVIGEAEVARIIGGVHPGIPVTNPLSAAKAALAALGVQRLGLLTPYTPDVTDAMRARFEQSGISVRAVGSFYEPSDAVVGRISPASILEAALAFGKSDDIDGLFISCTNLRAAGIIAEAEQKLGKPVTSSNHALAWHLLRLSGIDDAVHGKGRLFARALPQGSLSIR